MKKLFVCAMALAAFVSCSKDDVQGPALDSQNKSISITILNGSGATRAAGDAGITTPGQGTSQASAEATELKVLFLDGDDIVATLPLVNTGDATDEDHTGVSGEEYGVGQIVPGTTGEQNTYIWHNVPWTVDNIAVVRIDDGEGGLDAGKTFTKASEYLALAENETENLTRELDEIVLYGVDVDGLQDMNTTHEVNGITYHYWKAEVTVTPKLARFEINNIECTNLGVYNLPTNTDKTKYSFDELDILNLSWKSTGNKTYQIAVAADAIIGRMYGQYVPAEGTAVKDPNTYGIWDEAESRTRSANAQNAADAVKPANGNVWSWNVLPTSFYEMTVGLKAYAYNYVLDNGSASVEGSSGRDLTLTVDGLASSAANAEAGTKDANAFAAANIYQLNLQFVEENVMDEDKLCVQVTVQITPWTIKTVYPVFK